MKKILFTALLLVSVGLGSAVVGGPEAGDGELAITKSGSSASASASVGPNGTEWRSSVSNMNSSCMTGNQSQSVSFGDFYQSEENMTKIEFSGVLESSNPCHEVVVNVSKSSENVYEVELVEKSTGRICTSCIGALNFEASFQAPGDYRAVFKNSGEEIAVKETPGFENTTSDSDDPQSPKEESVWEAVSNWFRWLGF